LGDSRKKFLFDGTDPPNPHDTIVKKEPVFVPPPNDHSVMGRHADEEGRRMQNE
jgi:hypothetical protein